MLHTLVYISNARRTLVARGGDVQCVVPVGLGASMGVGEGVGPIRGDQARVRERRHGLRSHDRERGGGQ
jgi:hypothetical protein